VMLYSDGLTEGRNMAGEMYGLDRLVKAVELYSPQYESDGIVHHVALDYARFVEDHVQDDDVTLIAMKYVGKGMEHKAKTGGSDSEKIAWISKDDKINSIQPTVPEPAPVSQSPTATS